MPAASGEGRGAGGGFGRSVSARYSWHRDNLRSHQQALGRLAGSSAMFSTMIGRPLSSRAWVAQRRDAPVGATSMLPVGAPDPALLAAWWAPGADGEDAPAALPPRGLRPTVARGIRTRAGEATGPASAVERLAARRVYIHHPPEVTAVGPLLSDREAGRSRPAARREPRSTPGSSSSEGGSDAAGPAAARLSPAMAAALAATRPVPAAAAGTLPVPIRRAAARSAAGRATAIRLAQEVTAEHRFAPPATTSRPAPRPVPAGPVVALRPGRAAASAARSVTTDLRTDRRAAGAAPAGGGPGWPGASYPGALEKDPAAARPASTGAGPAGTPITGISAAAADCPPAGATGADTGLPQRRSPGQAATPLTGPGSLRFARRRFAGALGTGAEATGSRQGAARLAGGAGPVRPVLSAGPVRPVLLAGPAAVPAATVPAATVPAATVPAATVPAATVPATDDGRVPAVAADPTAPGGESEGRRLADTVGPGRLLRRRLGAVGSGRAGARDDRTAAGGAGGLERAAAAALRSSATTGSEALPPGRPLTAGAAAGPALSGPALAAAAARAAAQAALAGAGHPIPSGSAGATARDDDRSRSYPRADQGASAAPPAGAAGLGGARLPTTSAGTGTGTGGAGASGGGMSGNTAPRNTASGTPPAPRHHGTGGRRRLGRGLLEPGATGSDAARARRAGGRRRPLPTATGTAAGQPAAWAPPAAPGPAGPAGHGAISWIGRHAAGSNAGGPARETSGHGAGASGRGARPATPAAVRFASVMRSRRQDQPEALPSHLQPLARAIAGAAPVTISTGPTSRSALRAAGKRAATVGRVIHLERPPDLSPRSAEVLAHELVHAASPSPVPRFFGDDHRDAEETGATRTGTLMRALTAGVPLDMAAGGHPTIAMAARAAGGPTTAGGAAATGGAGAPGRFPSQAAARPHGPAAGGIAAPGANPVLRRRLGTEGLAVSGPRAFGANVSSRVGHAGAGAPEPLVPDRLPRHQGGAAGAGGVLQRDFFAARSLATGPNGAAPSPATNQPPKAAPVTDTPASPATAGATPLRLTPDLLEQIIEAVEERIIEDLERRGLRHNPGAF